LDSVVVIYLKIPGFSEKVTKPYPLMDKIILREFLEGKSKIAENQWNIFLVFKN